MKIRPACIETDLPGITGIINAYETQYLSEDIIRGWFEHHSPKTISSRLVALDDNGALLGYCEAVHEAYMPDKQFYTWVGVDPSFRMSGVGEALWNALWEFLQSQNAHVLKSDVRDNDPFALDFAEQRGFSIDRHIFESVLDLASFDETPYLPVIAALEARGVHFFSLADFNDTVENRHKLYELNNANVLDIPGMDDDAATYPEFEERVLKADWFRSGGQLLAVDGDSWVGLAAVILTPETRSAYNAHTGVRRAYRGKKIAQALKVFAVRYARQNGALIMRTNNDSQNEAMLAINHKMGYVPQPGKYVLKRILAKGKD